MVDIFKVSESRRVVLLSFQGFLWKKIIMNILCIRGTAGVLLLLLLSDCSHRSSDVISISRTVSRNVYCFHFIPVREENLSETDGVKGRCLVRIVSS